MYIAVCIIMITDYQLSPLYYCLLYKLVAIAARFGGQAHDSYKENRLTLIGIFKRVVLFRFLESWSKERRIIKCVICPSSTFKSFAISTKLIVIIQPLLGNTMNINNNYFA